MGGNILKPDGTPFLTSYVVLNSRSGKTGWPTLPGKRFEPRGLKDQNRQRWLGEQVPIATLPPKDE